MHRSSSSSSAQAREEHSWPTGCKELDDSWAITVVDRDNNHHYQPGYLFIPFGIYKPKQVVKPRDRYLPKADGVEFLIDPAVRIDKDAHTVTLESGRELRWDQLIIATGTAPAPEEIPGMADGKLWHDTVWDFYTLEGSAGLRQALKNFTKGKLVVHVTEMPIKCPVAPLEFALLAQDYMRKHGRNRDVDVTFVTPLDGAFTKPTASKTLGHLLGERGIGLETDFQIESIDNDNQQLVSYDGRRIDFDLAVTVPPNRGAKVIVDSGLGNEAGFVPVDKHTLQSLVDDDIWVIGDAGDAPTSKAGSVVHFMADNFVPNFLAHLEGAPAPERFDGHANCFIESGRGQALLLDFNYDQEPVTGVFPIPGVGPLKLLAPSVLNHVSKLAFEYIYWNLLVRGCPLPFTKDMQTAGKNL
ncbi:MAG: FAD/NAD(P)-binding oxidoreductase [Corynebacterium sp.]|nr:FAD/NAD(P)-binding oxidoreductase [Corynebacterium sp.]